MSNNILEFYFNFTKNGGNNINRSYIKESNIHGNGLFAYKDLNPGDFITVYPAHYIFDHNNKKILYSEENPYKDVRNYMYDYDKVNGISIAGDPDIINNTFFLAHIANDGYRSHSITNNKKNRNKYKKNTMEKSNSVFYKHKGVIQLTAYKNIKKDEEILVSYGLGYWVGYNLRSKINKMMEPFLKTSTKE